MTPILEVQDRRRQFYTHIGVVRTVDGAARAGHPGEALGIVGESGRGKRGTVVADAPRGSTALGRWRACDVAEQIGARS